MKKILFITTILMLTTSCETTTDMLTETEISEIKMAETEIETEIDCDDIEDNDMNIDTEIIYFNVPFDKSLQLHIFAECEEYNIAPAVILAILENEISNGTEITTEYATNIINTIRTFRKQNIDVFWVLLAYEGGTEYATEMMRNEKMDYAEKIMERAYNLETEAYGE